MSDFADTIKARYAARESEVDGFGRRIEVGRLRPGASLRVRSLMGSELPGIVTEALVAASVRGITGPDGKRVEFAPPRFAADLDHVLNTLDTEGMGAAVIAFGRLEGVEPEKDKKLPSEAAGAIDGAAVAQAVAGHTVAAAEPGSRSPNSGEKDKDGSGDLRGAAEELMAAGVALERVGAGSPPVEPEVSPA